MCGADTDGDGRGDADDHCPLEAHADQPDRDGDGPPDSYEGAYELLSPDASNDARVDDDGDGIGTLTDYRTGTGSGPRQRTGHRTRR